MAQGRDLDALLEGVEASFHGDSHTAVTGVSYDSRRVRPGHAFVAIPGFVHDGLDFVPDAVRAGARAVVAEVGPESVDVGARAWARVESAREALAGMACHWYGRPSRHLDVVGVTGTNGKTTVTALLEDLLSRRGPVGRWSTTRVRVDGEDRPTARTTPEAPELQAALAAMVAAGCHAAAIEVSSHALVLHRVAFTRFAAAVFTNLSPDHLDFHEDMDRYLDAKAILFESLTADAPAILNAGDPRAPRLAERTRGRVRWYGWDDAEPRPDYAIRDFRSGVNGMEMTLATPGGELLLRAPLFGRINAENVAAAVATSLELGADPAAVVEGLGAVAAEPGRLQRIETGRPFNLLVDYAHTPDALRGALEACREAVRPDGRLLVVFGCGGDRDRAKRPLMGEIAARLADRVWVTSDNPRSEAPGQILREVLAGVPDESRERVATDEDRRRAIAAALEEAREGDCILLAGKGHETEQVLADRTIPFDDRAVARELLAEVGPEGRAE